MARTKKQYRPHITCYTDGSYLPMSNVGGYCAYLGCGHKSLILSGTESPSTVNRMEIRAVIEALKLIKQPCIYHIYSDSKYVVDSISKGWLYSWCKNGWKNVDNKPILNKDLWEELLPLLKRHTVYIDWVKGHSGISGNELCDEVACMESKSLEYLINNRHRLPIVKPKKVIKKKIVKFVTKKKV